MKFYICVFFWKYVDKIHDSLKSDKNNIYIIWKRTYEYIIVLKQHISVTFMTIIKVSYNKNIISMQIIAKNVRSVYK